MKETEEQRQERLDAEWIHHMRLVKQRKIPGVWYPELDEIAAAHGFPGAFDVVEPSGPEDHLRPGETMEEDKGGCYES